MGTIFLIFRLQSFDLNFYHVHLYFILYQAKCMGCVLVPFRKCFCMSNFNGLARCFGKFIKCQTHISLSKVMNARVELIFGILPSSGVNFISWLKTYCRGLVIFPFSGKNGFCNVGFSGLRRFNGTFLNAPVFDQFIEKHDWQEFT